MNASSATEGNAEELSPASQLKLLTISLNRVVFSVHAIPVVACIFIFALWQHDYDITPLVIWALLYALGATLTRRWQASFREACATREPAQVNAQWIPRLQKVAALHGLALGSGTWLIALNNDAILDIFWLVSIAGILAINATHQTGILKSFQGFFALSWGQVALATQWTVPGYASLALALAAIYAFALYHHAKGVHRFFVQQMLLEQQSLSLARQFEEAREQAVQALAAKNRFLMTASHDLRQPVHAIGFLIESISFRNADPALRPAVTDLRTAVKAVQLMFDSLLDLSRIESDGTARTPEMLDMRAIISETLSLFESEARARGLHLSARVSRSAAWGLADPVLVRRALVNLAQNALRYTLEGRVLITVRRFGPILRLQVWDTGIGVAGSDQQKIYSPLYRQEHAWHISNEGHGLGLSVVARCAQLMDTGHGMRSEEGVGSVFWFDVPCAPGSTQKQETAAPADASDGPLDALQGRCLIVDDDPLVSSAWQHLLGSWGVQVQCVASGAAAFAQITRGFIPDAILCDQRLRSGESGVEVLQALFEQCPQACGAMVSGEHDSPALIQAEEHGYTVLRKPVDPALLRLLLEQWLGQRAAIPPG